MPGPTKHLRDDDDGSIHESKQGPTQSDGSWGRVSSNYHDNGAITNVHVTAVDGDGHKTIVNIPTDNFNLGDLFGNFDDGEDS